MKQFIMTRYGCRKCNLHLFLLQSMRRTTFTKRSPIGRNMLVSLQGIVNVLRRISCVLISHHSFSENEREEGEEGRKVVYPDQKAKGED